jgi:hypothetical protein
MARTPIHPASIIPKSRRNSAFPPLNWGGGSTCSEPSHRDHQRSARDHGRYGAGLGDWLGTSSEFWLNLQMLYELRLAREKVGDRVERLPKLTARKRSKARRAA